MSEINHIFMPEDHMDKLYNSTNPLVKFVHVNRLTSIIKEVLSGGKDVKILDAGCGEGHLIERLNNKNSNNQYYGIDITDLAIKKAKERCPFATLKIMDLSKINFDDASFDYVICTEVLEHIHAYTDVIKELKRVLKKGGYLIITFPNEILWTISRFLLGRRPIKVPDHVNSFTPNKIKHSIKMKVISQINLPFGFPFFISLGCLMKFQK